MRKSIQALSLILCAICPLGLHAEAIDYEVSPSPGENFLEARFRFVNPDPSVVPERILVYLPGTDSDARYVVTDEEYLEACRKCHAALVGCYFRGEGLPYDAPTGGSGRALDEALRFFATQTKHPELSTRPLLLMGFSQGSQFTYNYLCWKPARIGAFAAIKAGGFQLSPQAASYQVPGVIVAGEYDSVGRIRTSARAFAGAAGKHSRWAFLEEKGAGHDMARIGGYVFRFFEALCEDGNPSDVVYRRSDTKQSDSASSVAEDLCWFPDSSTADAWAHLHLAAPLAELEAAVDPPDLASFVGVSLEPSFFECENNQTEIGAVKIVVRDDQVSISQVIVSGNAFSSNSTGFANPLPVVPISFAPKNQNWGPLPGDLIIAGRKNGRDLGPLEIKLQGRVRGAARSSPSLIYFGAIGPRGKVDRTVQICSIKAGLHVSGIACSPDVSAKLGPRNSRGGYDLVADWSPGDRLGQMNGTIEITFDQPIKGILRIPVVGVVSR